MLATYLGVEPHPGVQPREGIRSHPPVPRVAQAGNGCTQRGTGAERLGAPWVGQPRGLQVGVREHVVIPPPAPPSDQRRRRRRRYYSLPAILPWQNLWQTPWQTVRRLRALASSSRPGFRYRRIADHPSAHDLTVGPTLEHARVLELPQEPLPIGPEPAHQQDRGVVEPCPVAPDKPPPALGFMHHADHVYPQSARRPRTAEQLAAGDPVGRVKLEPRHRRHGGTPMEPSQRHRPPSQVREERVRRRVGADANVMAFPDRATNIPGSCLGINRTRGAGTGPPTPRTTSRTRCVYAKARSRYRFSGTGPSRQRGPFLSRWW